jgi:Immunoglobulin I-set domain
MKVSTVRSVRNRIEKFAQSGFSALGARRILGALALIAILWIGGCGSASTTPGNTAPAITTQPTSTSVAAGATATFTAAATGTPAPTVQWQVSTNGGTSFTAVAGATSTTLSFTTTGSQTGSLYEAVFTNSVSSVTTTAATLTVTTAPAITTNPASTTVAVGANASFTAAASGTPTPTVQWQVSTDGGTTFTNLSGATTATLTITAATAAMNGNVYKAVFTNTGGTVTSTAATLTVTSAPLITTNPVNVTVLAGANASFTAAASGTPAPTVQWQVSTNGGTTFANLAGATSPTLTITAATAAMNGNQYKAVFTNSTSSATTTTATLTVNVAPVVTTNPTNVSVSAGSIATFTAAALTGLPAPTVQWMVSTNGGTTFSPVPGATSTTLSFTANAAMNANVYEAVFTNAAGTATSTTATLTVTSAPTITTNPAPLTIGNGGTAVFTAAATGNPAPTVQWFVSTNGGASFNAIGGATSPTLSFTASLAQSGNLYQAVFTNSVSTSTTTPALLTVTASVTVSVAITNPSTSPTTVGTGAVLNFSATITNGAAGTGVNWSVNGIAGGNTTVGTITASTLSGALATYTAPATAPGAAVAIVATYAGAGAAASAPANVNVVANHNATLSGQFAFQVRGFQVSELPFGMVGTFTANGSGALSNVFIDTNAVTSAGGGSTVSTKVPWSGTYSMDSASHGIMHLTLTSAPATQLNFGFTFNGGNGSMVELDTPLGSTASGSFSAASASSFTLAAGGLNGPYVMRLDGPATPFSNGYNAVLGQLTFAQTGSSTTAGTVVGSFTDNGGNATSTVPPSTVSMDTDVPGHGTIAITLSNGGAATLAYYVSSSGRIFMLDIDSGSSIQTGLLRSQTIPAGGFTAANIFTSAMLFEAGGVDPTTGHASVIVGGFSPGAGNSVTGEFDANDGGTIPAGSPVALTGTYTVSATVPGLGTITFTNGLSFVFYMRSPGQGFILEDSSLSTSASRIGQIGSQTEPVGGFVATTLAGATQNVGTVTTTPASANGIAVITFPTGTTYSATADGSALAQSPFISATSTGTVVFTDAVRGRATLTPGTGSIFGSAHTVFYAIDNTGAFIMISVDPTTLEPQIVIVGN